MDWTNRNFSHRNLSDQLILKFVALLDVGQLGMKVTRIKFKIQQYVYRMS